MAAVAELALGFLVDLSRGVSRAAATTRPAACPEIAWAGSSPARRPASSATGRIARHLAPILAWPSA